MDSTEILIILGLLALAMGGKTPAAAASSSTDSTTPGDTGQTDTMDNTQNPSSNPGGTSDPTQTGILGAWFDFGDGHQYRLIRSESIDPVTGATNIELYQQRGDSQHVYMLDHSKTHMLGMELGAFTLPPEN